MKEKNNMNSICQINGTVTHGRGIGKLVGMPTIDLKIAPDYELPNMGVYASKILIDGQSFYGLTHIGPRPTIDYDSRISIETYLFGFNREIYGHFIELQLFQRIRSIQRFDDLSALLRQFRQDCAVARNFWKIESYDSPLSIDTQTHLVRIGEEKIYLSIKEFDVLYLLFSNPGIVLTKKQIYETVWHEPAIGSYHAVENTIFQIRKKLNPYFSEHNIIKTVVGLGYKYEPG